MRVDADSGERKGELAVGADTFDPNALMVEAARRMPS